MITIYGKGFSQEDCISYTPIIYNNIITSIKTLLDQVSNFGGLQDKGLAEHMTFMQQLDQDTIIDDEIASRIAALWADGGVQNTYENRAHYQLTDSADYFFNQMAIVGSVEYIPTEQDVLRSRVRTTGIVENEFHIDGNQFKMYDVGGQRNERKKWIHCFDKVTSVLFVAAISEYDMVLYEDSSTNRMTEALALFEEICNSIWFSNTSMILFLNKKDLFEDKFQKIPITHCPEFANFEGSSLVEAITFIEDTFVELNHNPDKQVYYHVTCATDTTNVVAVFNAVKDIIIRKSLEEAGLV
jgi:guanine nucleotide-binding protein G(i) subunit alpha